MFRLLFILIALTLNPVAHATSNASFASMSCSGTLTSSLVSDASYICAGNLSVIGGSIISDSKVLLKSDGMLFLDNISLNAPFIELLALNGGVTFGSNVILSASSSLTVISGIPPAVGDITQPVMIKTPLLKGGNIALTPSVPEPESYAMILLGLSIIGFASRSTIKWNA
jgi:PEP-CTERM motif